VRQCGECQLCCKLLPMVDNEPWRKGAAINKPANVKCPHQRFKKGCAIYADRPFCCHVWTCRWLTEQDTADLKRPDHAHLVIDVMPDYVTVQNDETGEQQNLQVVQVWCDPRFPEAHRDPAFRRFVDRRGEEGIATLVRFNSSDAITIFPPSLSPDGEWHEMGGNSTKRDRSPEEMMAFLSGAKIGIGFNP
jgi:hypothetical protein